MSLVFSSLLIFLCVQAANIEEQLQTANGDRRILKDTRVLGWVDDPSYRGTSTILWSCSVTILASVYTAIHPNIPVRHISKQQRFLGKLRWSFVALLFPELILQLAFRQLLAARKLVAQLNSSEHPSSLESRLMESDRSQDNSLGNPKSFKPSYNMAYGFYVEMGGFVVDTSTISSRYSFVAITARGARHLARAGHVFGISPGQIADRSKSNALAKFLVCLQVSWMFLQCTIRASIGYPLTLLEIHTMTHVACAIVIYLLWWNKPSDIEESQVVHGNTQFMDTIALMLMSTQSRSGDRSPELSELQFMRNSEHSVDTVSQSRDNNHEQNEDGLVSLKRGQGLQCGLGPAQRDILLTRKDIKRWRSCARATHDQDTSRLVQAYRDSVRTQSQADSILGVGGFRNPARLVEIMLKMFDSNTLFVAACLLPLLYGGAHLTAWNFGFPSYAESLLWKVSGILIMVMTPVAVALFWSTFITGFFAFFALEWLIFSGIIPLIFMFCRLYLVIESFISLRNSPLGVFATIPWLEAFPHI